MHQQSRVVVRWCWWWWWRFFYCNRWHYDINSSSSSSSLIKYNINNYLFIYLLFLLALYHVSRISGTRSCNIYKKRNNFLFLFFLVLFIYFVVGIFRFVSFFSHFCFCIVVSYTVYYNDVEINYCWFLACNYWLLDIVFFLFQIFFSSFFIY